MADWSLIGVRCAIYLTLATLFGLSAFSLYALREGERRDALALCPWLVASAVLSLLFSAVWIVLLVSSMAGTPAWPIDREAVGALLTGSAIGAAWKLRMVMLAFAGLSALFAARRKVWLSAVAICSAVALATLAWTGHGAMDDGATGWVHLIADILHLIAAGAWVGALLGLILLVSRPAARVDPSHLVLTHRALHEFATMGTMVVGTLIVTGVVNAWLLVGIDNVLNLGSSSYGRLLIAKIVLFGAMLGLASLNRFRFTPAFERSIASGSQTSALGVLRRSLGLETAMVVSILALVAWLGRLEPPASM